MKTILSALIILLFAVSTFAQINDFIESDTMNVCIYKIHINNDSYELQEYAMNYYPPCYDNCGSDSLPFDIEQQSPDIGFYKLKYLLNDALIIHLTDIWMGENELVFPDNMQDASELAYVYGIVELPEEYDLFFAYAGMEDLSENIPDVWYQVQSLELTHLFADGPFQVGFLPYVLGQSMTGDVNTWFIILYKNTLPTGTGNTKTDDQWMIRQAPGHIIITGNTTLTAEASLFNSLGNCVFKKKIRNNRVTLDTYELSQGMYVLRIQNKTDIFTRRLILR